MRQSLSSMVRQLLNDSESISFDELDALIIKSRTDAEIMRRAVSGRKHSMAVKYQRGQSLTDEERHQLYQLGVHSIRQHAVVKWRLREKFSINSDIRSISHVRT
jgi:hypothetical protein